MVARRVRNPARFDAGEPQQREPTETRPWGQFFEIDEGPLHKVKRIEVLPGRRLSYQFHHYRSEHWFIVQGRGQVTLDGQERLVQPGDSVEVPAGTPHRIKNCGDDDLVFIEVQRGTYLGEDDIRRIEDDFGRAT